MAGADEEGQQAQGHGRADEARQPPALRGEGPSGREVGSLCKSLVCVCVCVFMCLCAYVFMFFGGVTA